MYINDKSRPQSVSQRLKTTLFRTSGVSWFLVIAVAGIVLVFVRTLSQLGSGDDTATELLVHARSIGMTVHSAECMDTDSDGDGYVSCTVGSERPDGKGIEPIAFECAAKYSLNKGCRLRSFVVKGTP